MFISLQNPYFSQCGQVGMESAASVGRDAPSPVLKARTVLTREAVGPMGRWGFHTRRTWSGCHPTPPIPSSPGHSREWWNCSGAGFPLVTAAVPRSCYEDKGAGVPDALRGACHKHGECVMEPAGLLTAEVNGGWGLNLEPPPPRGSWDTEAPVPWALHLENGATGGSIFLTVTRIWRGLKE